MAIVDQLRQIQKPSAYSMLYQCGVDGSASEDVLIKELHSTQAPIVDDDALRARIYERYIHYNGRLFEDTLQSYELYDEQTTTVPRHLRPRNVRHHGKGCYLCEAHSEHLQIHVGIRFSWILRHNVLDNLLIHQGLLRAP